MTSRITCHKQPLSHPSHNSIKGEGVRLSKGEVGLYMILVSISLNPHLLGSVCLNTAYFLPQIFSPRIIFLFNSPGFISTRFSLESKFFCVTCFHYHPYYLKISMKTL